MNHKKTNYLRKMEQFTADKRLETFEDFEKVYDECLNYLREENINIDQELQDLDEKVPNYESIANNIKSQSNLDNNNLLNNIEMKVYDKQDAYYADLEEQNNSKAYLHQENINIDPEMNDLDESDPDYEIIVEKIKPKINSHEGIIHHEEESIRDDETNAFYTSSQDASKTNLPKDNNLNNKITEAFNETYYKRIDEKIKPKMLYQVENELKSDDSIDSVLSEARSERLRKLSQQLPKIIITQSNSSLNVRRHDDLKLSELKKANYASDGKKVNERRESRTSKSKEPNGKKAGNHFNNIKYHPRPKPYGEHPKRLVCKRGVENVALISNVPFERIRLLNDTFHTLINLRWRWIVTGTIVVHFAIWLVFAVFWYIAAYAHYDFEPDPPARTCVTGGHDFLTIFLASVEAQTTIGFGDRAIDEECPESIFLFIMQLILGTGLSGVLTCVVYAKLTRPEKLSRDGVGFSKKAVISTRDGRLCLMMRAWDLNYDHIISSEFTAHFINTYKTKEGEIIRYFAQSLTLQQRQFLLWPVTLVHVIDSNSPLYKLGPDDIANDSYEITLSLKGASASMGTFTQSQTSYLPKEVLWGYRFPPVVKYDMRKRKYVIEQNKLDAFEPVDTPFRSAHQISSGSQTKANTPHTPQPLHTPTPGTPGSFCEQISSFQLERSSSFRKKGHK